MKKQYYIIENDGFNQPSFITPVKLTKDEFEEVFKTRRYNNLPIYTITDSYMSALYITQN